MEITAENFSNGQKLMEIIFQRCTLGQLTFNTPETLITPPYAGCLPLIIDGPEYEVYNCNCPVRDFLIELQKNAPDILFFYQRFFQNLVNIYGYEKALEFLKISVIYLYVLLKNLLKIIEAVNDEAMEANLIIDVEKFLAEKRKER